MISNMADTPLLIIPETQRNRYENLYRKFTDRFGHPPTFFGRAPGRVNIIGEHIDYSGYGVLPMAIEQDVVIAVSHDQASNTIVVSNTDPAFRDFECDKNDINLNKISPEWYNYFLCGVLGVHRHQGSHRQHVEGMACMVSGTVPISAGLSSSSALVCCSALITMHANRRCIPKDKLVDLSADCENFMATSTEGGNMDQAIAFMAEEGLAQFIEFSPLRITPVQLPPEVVFVITHSCTEIHKGATACFNIRVVECRIAAQVIAKKKGLAWRHVTTLRDVQEKLGLGLLDALAVAKELLHPDAYTKHEVCQMLEVTDDELSKTSLIAFTETENVFHLHNRAIHVYSEAERVHQFRRVCEIEGNDPDNLQQLGELMTASHWSCHHLFDCSSEELNILVKTCMESGALGSRLTGAGWGGCVVSMVPRNKVETFLQKVKENFYANEPSRSGRVETAVFISQPGGGAALYTF
ncbi:N-acetylgalactosamine kinase-like [Mizuhopecten yessoensis]|uniref:N-acetylgalactosamine kinase n=1 Tax=Mizuhopecten yessoensis TaxID=6573 RepID=A0A210R324_MIZYE|nr:N-acetylgalactosamine kinase-like [Mizuhopecten yessoensis]OWF55326.1 N-acetylgalactosamine kinase [Mizuhopecten yessoensis]